MKIESKEQALKFLRQRVRYFGGYNYLAVEKPEVESLIAWLESAHVVEWEPSVRGVDHGERIACNAVDGECWSCNGPQVPGETHHFKLASVVPPPKPVAKPPTIGERVASSMFTTGCTMNRENVAKFIDAIIDDAIAEDREGGQ